eukprot:TRINITY_DN2983_c0_g1_i3.p1 TRINITY_DN2983_c0_g1~~TRINITY_DN2983_c0_g1_i3.p1  ORF type:complete len:438 (+),score=58.34 TRINITY_DN2983_c0_g1_i3:63-1316(+)
MLPMELRRRNLPPLAVVDSLGDDAEPSPTLRKATLGDGVSTTTSLHRDTKDTLELIADCSESSDSEAIDDLLQNVVTIKPPPKSAERPSCRRPVLGLRKPSSETVAPDASSAEAPTVNPEASSSAKNARRSDAQRHDDDGDVSPSRQRKRSKPAPRLNVANFASAPPKSMTACGSSETPRRLDPNAFGSVQAGGSSETPRRLDPNAFGSVQARPSSGSGLLPESAPYPARRPSRRPTMVGANAKHDNPLPLEGGCTPQRRLNVALFGSAPPVSSAPSRASEMKVMSQVNAQAHNGAYTVQFAGTASLSTACDASRKTREASAPAQRRSLHLPQQTCERESSAQSPSRRRHSQNAITKVMMDMFKGCSKREVKEMLVGYSKEEVNDVLAVLKLDKEEKRAKRSKSKSERRASAGDGSP